MVPDEAERFGATNQALLHAAEFFMKNQSEPVTPFPPVHLRKPPQRATAALPEGVRSWVESCLVPNMVRAYMDLHHPGSQNAVAESEETVAECPERTLNETEDAL